MLAAKTSRLKEKIAKLGDEMRRLAGIEAQMLAAPDQQVSLTDPDARSMATNGRGSGVVGYNVRVAVETEHHLIVAHEVTNVGSDRAQLAAMAKEAKAALGVETLDAVADRGYYNGEEILACEQAGITVTLPKPMTSGAKSEGRFGKQDFVYRPEEDVYRCPAGETLTYRYDEGAHGRDALSDEDAASRLGRDGAARARLQPDPRPEHHGKHATPRGDEGVEAAPNRSVHTVMRTRPEGSTRSAGCPLTTSAATAFLHDQNPQKSFS